LALNFTIIGDNYLAKKLEVFKPHFNITDINKPFSISGNMSLLSSVTSILSNYLDTPEENQDSDPIYEQLTKIAI